MANVTKKSKCLIDLLLGLVLGIRSQNPAWLYFPLSSKSRRLLSLLAVSIVLSHSGWCYSNCWVDCFPVKDGLLDFYICSGKNSSVVGGLTWLWVWVFGFYQSSCQVHMLLLRTLLHTASYPSSVVSDTAAMPIVNVDKKMSLYMDQIITR